MFSAMVQIRNVPLGFHRRLKARAALPRRDRSRTESDHLRGSPWKGADSHRIRLGADAPAIAGGIAGAVVRRPESSSISPSVRDALAVIHQQALEPIVRGASLDAVPDALCDGIDALDPDLISSVLLADPDGQRLWPQAGRRVPKAGSNSSRHFRSGRAWERAAQRRLGRSG
jgi:hypothetical protein